MWIRLNIFSSNLIHLIEITSHIYFMQWELFDQYDRTLKYLYPYLCVSLSMEFLKIGSPNQTSKYACSCPKHLKLILPTRHTFIIIFIYIVRLNMYHKRATFIIYLFSLKAFTVAWKKVLLALIELKWQEKSDVDVK